MALITSVNKNRLVKRFIRYVKIDSLSGEEAQFSSLVKKDLQRLGLKVSTDKIGNLFAKLPARSSKTILLNAHLDTVAPGKGIKPKINNGVIKSSGKTILGADNKAGVAAIIEALTVIREKKLFHPNLLIVFTVQEEIGLAGAKAIDPKGIKADFGYVLDGGKVFKINCAAPSQHNLYAEIIGRAAHAGVHPEEGVSAIITASQAIAKMKLGRIDYETTANIGIIEGGRATNIIPERVVLKGEARSHDQSKLKRQILHMLARLQAACKANKAKLKVKITPMYKAFCIGEKETVLKIAKQAGEELGIRMKVERSGGGSDANIFNQLGIKSVILGVGAGKIHTAKELLSVNQFVLGTQLILEVIKNV